MEKNAVGIRQDIESGKTVLGIELGSTRIKAILIDNNHKPIASGSFTWENQYENGIWTYDLDHVWTGLQTCYRELSDTVFESYQTRLTSVGALGFSGMMHGYLVFDQAGKLLIPFRTWRNNITGEAAGKLTERFGFNIPQRWSIAHLYQALLNKEKHIPEIATMTTLAGYVHWQLTGEKVMGIGEASGVFPIDSTTLDYDAEMLVMFNQILEHEKVSWRLEHILPEVLSAGEEAGLLTEHGAKLIDPEGNLQQGVPLCPPEGDAGTGMVATNSVAKKTGNVSAGTSVFAMIVLEKALSNVYPEVDMVATPAGASVAMVHSNNCTSDLDAWVALFQEFTDLIGQEMDDNALYGTLYKHALQADPDGGGLLAFNYLSGEHITHFTEGRPLFVRTPKSQFSLANFMRTHLNASLGALRIGLDILFEKENVELDQILGHGGFFKTRGVGQRIMAAAMNVPVSLMETAGEGGAWGIAILAAYMMQRDKKETLHSYLQHQVFAEVKTSTIFPEKRDVEGFTDFMDRYKKGLAIERSAVAQLKDH